MGFLSILICLAIEKWTEFGKKVRFYELFTVYIKFITSTFRGYSQRGLLGLFVFLMPICAVVGIIYYLLLHFWFGLFAFLFSTMVLIYCLGSFDYNEKTIVMKHYHTVPEEVKIENMLVLSERNIFSVIFWFMLLGPIGAVLYRLTEVLVEHKNNHSVSLSAAQFQQLLAWLPVRLQTLSFALVSHFAAVMQSWLTRFLNKISHNDEMLITCGWIALGEKIKDKNNIQEMSGLIDRALIVWLVVMALIILV